MEDTHGVIAEDNYDEANTPYPRTSPEKLRELLTDFVKRDQIRIYKKPGEDHPVVYATTEVGNAIKMISDCSFQDSTVADWGIAVHNIYLGNVTRNSLYDLSKYHRVIDWGSMNYPEDAPASYRNGLAKAVGGDAELFKILKDAKELPFAAEAAQPNMFLKLLTNAPLANAAYTPLMSAGYSDQDYPEHIFANIAAASALLRKNVSYEPISEDVRNKFHIPKTSPFIYEVQMEGSNSLSSLFSGHHSYCEAIKSANIMSVETERYDSAQTQPRRDQNGVTAPR